MTTPKTTRNTTRKTTRPSRGGTADRRAESGAALELLDAVRSAATLDDAVAASVTIVQRRFGWPYAAYLWRDPVDDRLKCRHDWGKVALDFQTATRAAAFSEGEALSGRAWQAADIVSVDDFGAVKEFSRAPVARRAGVRFAVAVPIRIGARVVGSLEWYAAEAGPPPAEQLEVLRRVGFLLSAKAGEQDLERLSAMYHSMPINAVYADREHVIRYVNPAALAGFAKLEGALGVPVEQLLGRRLDVLHPDLASTGPAGDLAQPHKVVVTLGAELVELVLNPVRDESGELLGSLLTWEVVTKKREAQRELARSLSMLENTPTNLLSCDPDLTIGYVNPAARQTMQSLAGRVPPQAVTLAGQSLAVLYPDGEAMARILADPANLPHRSVVRLGSEDFDIVVSAVYDFKRNYLGPMVTWEVVTERLETERRAREAAERERLQAEELRAKVDALLASVDAAAQGDLTRTVTVGGADAVGHLGEGLGAFLEDLRGSVGSIAGNANRLADASGVLSDVSRQMAANAEETATQASVVSAASEQVSKNVQTVATGTEQMGASIREIAKNATDAARVATHAVRVADTTNATVAKLGESSAEIGKVIKVITSIAQQTNLLALNATIEAARAGEAGKGFAVVANEVKELAKATAKATEDIGQKIEAIQSDTKGAVAAIREISEIINQINDIQSTIASAVEEQTATTNEIGRNVAEAAKGSAEIAQNITGVAQAAQQTTEGAAGSQRAAGELRSMAAELQALVGRFRF